MPSSNLRSLEPKCLRVLVTGFGPYMIWDPNPSWLAARLLHDVVLSVDPNLHPLEADAMDTGLPSRHIYCQAVQFPMSYDTVQAQVPLLHARPPVLPETDPELVPVPPPEDGYDFIFHLGGTGRGPLRMERLAHKSGYRMKDVDKKHAPIIEKPAAKDNGSNSGSNSDHSGSPPQPNVPVGEIADAEMADPTFGHHHPVHGPPPGHPDPTPPRGLSKNYETFPEDFYVTDPDIEKLCRYLKDSGDEFKTSYTSMDAGHHVADFTYYCSLAEAKRTAGSHHRGRVTRVFFMHCPPVGSPYTSEEVAEAVRRIIVWICSTPPPPPPQQLLHPKPQQPAAA